MKEIKAIIRPGKLPQVREALRKLPGCPGMTVSEAEGFSAPAQVSSIRNIKQVLTDYSPKTHLEIIAPDDLVAEIVNTICTCAATGQLGDGVVWVNDVETFTRIGRGENLTET